MTVLPFVLQIRHGTSVRSNCVARPRGGGSSGGPEKNLSLPLQESQWLPSCSHLYCPGIKRSQGRERTQAEAEVRSRPATRLSAAQSPFQQLFFFKKISKD